MSLQNAIREFPEISQKEELDYLTVKSYFLLADYSVESKKAERYKDTMKSWETFNAEYPVSKYTNELKSIAEKTESGLKKLEAHKDKQTNNLINEYGN